MYTRLSLLKVRTWTNTSIEGVDCLALVQSNIAVAFRSLRPVRTCITGSNSFPSSCSSLPGTWRPTKESNLPVTVFANGAILVEFCRMRFPMPDPPPVSSSRQCPQTLSRAPHSLGARVAKAVTAYLRKNGLSERSPHIRAVTKQPGGSKYLAPGINKSPTFIFFIIVAALLPERGC